jgi:hypothetical protein
MSTVHSERRGTLVADAAVFSADRRLQLLVVTKSSTDTSATWAMELLNNLLDDSDLARTPYILLTTRDHFYLWRQGPESKSVHSPDFISPMAPILAPFFANGAKGLEAAGRFGFEMAVLSWLYELVRPQGKNLAKKEVYRWLLDSGLYDAIEGGSVEPEIRL